MSLYPKNSGRATHEVATGHTHVYLVGQRTCQTLAARTGTLSRSPERFVAQRGQCLGNANQTTVGQTRLALPLKEIIETQQQTNSIEILPVTLAHVLALENLPAYHKDPFDRLLVAQAQGLSTLQLLVLVEV